MNKTIALSMLLVLLVGCKAPKEPGPLPPPEGDLVHLIGADPAAVTSADLLQKVEAADVRARAYHVSNGIYWQAQRSGEFDWADVYGKGGDTLLFTGNYLAACAYRYGVTRDTEDLDKALHALRGVYILTHVSGKPGVLMRCAFQSDLAERFLYPLRWQSRIDAGFVYDSPGDLDDPFFPGRKFPKMTYYTRVTRDQVTGLIYGLSVFWEVVTADDVATAADRTAILKGREIAAQITHDVYAQLRANDWKIKDQTGRNDTGSDHVGEDLLRLSLLGVYRKTLTDGSRKDRIEGKYQDLLWNIRVLGGFPSDPFNRFSNAQQYYAWNLRFTRSASVWLTAVDDDRKMIADYVNRWLFKSVKNHKNAWFSLIYAVASGDKDVAADGVLSLKSWSLRPVIGWPSPVADGWGRGHEEPNMLDKISGAADDRVLWPHLRKPTGYWTWQKDPWDAARTHPTPKYDTGTLDLLLPYWMARYHGLIQQD